MSESQPAFLDSMDAVLDLLGPLVLDLHIEQHNSGAGVHGNPWCARISGLIQSMRLMKQSHFLAVRLQEEATDSAFQAKGMLEWSQGRMGSTDVAATAIAQGQATFGPWLLILSGEMPAFANEATVCAEWVVGCPQAIAQRLQTVQQEAVASHLAVFEAALAQHLNQARDRMGEAAASALNQHVLGQLQQSVVVGQMLEQEWAQRSAAALSAQFQTEPSALCAAKKKLRL